MLAGLGLTNDLKVAELPRNDPAILLLLLLTFTADPNHNPYPH